MSAGTPLKAIRIPPDLGTEINVTINRRNDNSREAPWTFTDFCLTAIREKILKMARSGGRPRPFPRVVKGEPIQPTTPTEG